MGGGVELERTDLEHGRKVDRAASRQRPQACQQLGEGEGLRQVVVGPVVQPFDPVLHRVPGGEHEHRRPDSVGTKAAADLEAGQARQHHVEHDRVVVRCPSHPEGVLASCRNVGGVPVFEQPPPEEARHLQLVLDDQHPHGHIVDATMRDR